jgi:hypothetical protein
VAAAAADMRRACGRGAGRAAAVRRAAPARAVRLQRRGEGRGAGGALDVRRGGRGGGRGGGRAAAGEPHAALHGVGT